MKKAAVKELLRNELDDFWDAIQINFAATRGTRPTWKTLQHQEQPRLYEWIEQTERDAAGTGRIPAVHHRKNRCDTLVTIRLDDFIRLIKNNA